MKFPDKINLVLNRKKEISMTQPVTPPRIQQPPAEPGAPVRPTKKILVPQDMNFKSARILFPEPGTEPGTGPAAGKPQAVASKIVDIVANLKNIR